MEKVLVKLEQILVKLEKTGRKYDILYNTEKIRRKFCLLLLLQIIPGLYIIVEVGRRFSL